MPRIWTIGYETLLPAELVAELEAHGIERLIDVRIRPQSRRAGMSKTRLGELLAEHRIAYESRRELGTPPDIKVDFRQGRIAEARERYAAYVEEERHEQLDALTDELLATDPVAPRTALLCFEEDPAVCHRRVIVERLADRIPDLEVVDL
jgi:uncharacterized protein (DUF488 family)